MKMEETPRSLRGYLLLVGLIGLLRNAAEIWQSGRLGTVYTIDAVVGIGFSLGYLYAGLRLPTLLSQGGRLLMRLLLASIAYRALGLLLVAVTGGDTMAALVGTAVGIAIGVYLLSNVRRLVREAGRVPTA